MTADRQHSSRRWILTDTGRRQAEAAGAWLRGENLDAYDRHYCSPYVRTMHTAALLGLLDAEWWLEPLLRERDRGYEYVAPPEALAREFRHSIRTKNDDRFLWRPAGGESIADVDLRLRQVLSTLARELDGRRVICVTHEDAMDALRFRLEKMTIEDFTTRAEGGHEAIGNGWILHWRARSVRFARTAAAGVAVAAHSAARTCKRRDG
ncbi:MAG TPA: histidine phosphatase family protein [Acidimicrobiales bacterium]|nr:histidine phosphatase family protein [Acidimicrobiales bacterium]